MEIKHHVENREQLCKFFTELGKELADVAPELEHAVVVTIDGDDGCGKSIISDHIINGSITIDSRELEAHYHEQSEYHGRSGELTADDLKYFDEHNDYDHTERIYELWTGQGEREQGLRAFFCNSAVLPRDEGVETIQSFMRHPQEITSLPDNLHAVYRSEDAKTYFDNVADFILVTNSGDSRHMAADLSIELVWTEFDERSRGRDITMVLSADSPVYDKMLEVCQSNDSAFAPSHD